MIKRFLILLGWGIPFSMIAMMSAIAMVEGIEHTWLNTVLIVSSVLSVLVCIYGVGLCVALYSKFEYAQLQHERLSQVFADNEQKLRHLKSEVEKLTGMREIQMSSHIDGFSDLLKNILKVTHIATEAKALTIYLESHDQLGSTYPKAHMRWEGAGSKVPGEIYMFFDRELLVAGKDSVSITEFGADSFPQVSDDNPDKLEAVLMCGSGSVGSVNYRNTRREIELEHDIESLKSWMSEYELVTKGVFSCWKTRSFMTIKAGDLTYVSVPIFSQGVLVGVLSAEFAGLNIEDGLGVELRDLCNTLLDYGRNIGQPLKKEELYEQAIKDGLTGMFNKAHYESQLAEHFMRSKRYGRELSYIFVDIDHFKSINDTYGHLTGDMALKAVAKILHENIRQSDMAFRIGGEELCVLLVETGIEEAMGVAEKLRQAIEAAEYPTEEGGTIKFTSSFGVSCIDVDMTKGTDLSSAADKALYKAKETGRNQVISSEDL